MNEFRVHHLVSQLLTQLRVQDSHSPEVFAELLTKNLTPYVTTQVSTHHAKRKIAEFSPKGEEFLKKYDELKPKQTRALDPLVYLLSNISEDKALCEFLQQRFSLPQTTAANASTEIETIKLPGDSQEFTLPPSGTIMTQKELDKLRGDLANLTQALSGKDIARKDKTQLKGLPKPPAWISEQRYLSNDFITPAKPPSTQPVMKSLPVHSQELAIIEDLLFLMIGINGKYIMAKPLSGKLALRTFSVDHTLDLSMHALVNRILPLCSYYSTISRFLEEYSQFQYGMVNQALCASMRGVIKEYLILVAQLEHQYNLQQLSLQKLWYYIQPSLKSLEILSSVAVAIQSASCKGGPVLSVLHDKTQSLTGDDKAQELCLHLTQAAAVPYFDIMEQWIYKGIVQDPYQEFMVEDHKTVEKEQLSKEYNDSYWESRYTIASEKIPSFLEHVATKILNAGKYLNVIHECGVEISYSGATELIYSLHNKQYVEQIEQAFAFASKKLLDLLIKEHDLIGRLTSIKHYFLLEQGDYLVHFMDIAYDELKKKTSEIQLTRLESLLELALRTSVAVSDPFKDDLKAMLSSFDLTTQLFHIMSIQPDIEDNDGRKRSAASFPLPNPSTINLSGLEAFSLDYKVGWPLSLIINRKALTKYQLLFRHLFYCKHIERQLCAAWLNRKADKQEDQPLSWHTAAFILQQQMLVFVQSFQYYMMFEVIEPNWTVLYQNLQSVSTVDDVLACHTDFLDACLKDCMLTNSDVLRTITELMVVCATYSGCMKRYGNLSEPPPIDHDDKSSVLTHIILKHTTKLIATDNVEQTISNFDREFTKHVLALLEKLTHISTSESEHSMLNLVARLDYNGFFTEKPEN